MAKITVGQRIADLLKAEGVTAFFNLPEVSLGKLHAALVDHGIKMYAPRHEAAASFMAEGYVSATGKFTMVCAACGPGVTNLYSAIANAHEENMPILYVGTERQLVARNLPRSGQFQVSTGSVELLKPITKYSTMVEDHRLIDDIFREAFRQMTTGKPGPVYIGLPFDMVTAEYDFGPLIPPEKYRPSCFIDTFPDRAIDDVVRQIRAASNPVILAGSGVRLANAHGLFRDFVEAAGCPVFLSPGGAGILPNSHPQVFDIGFAGGEDVLNDADLIFAVGTAIGEKLGYGGNPNFHGQTDFPPYLVKADRKWIVLDSDPTNIGRNRPVDTALVGDMRIGLPKLTNMLNSAHASPDRADYLARHRKTKDAYFSHLFSDTPDTSPVHMGRLFVEVQRALPSDTTIVLDGGTSRAWAATFLRGDYVDVVKPMKLGNLGLGMSYAVGMAAAREGRSGPICIIGGDGSHGFYPMELETAVRYKCPIVHVVTYDQGWGLEEPYYLYQTGRVFEVDISPQRLDDFARSLGAHGEYCKAADEIGPAMQRAIESGKPAIVQIEIDRQVSSRQFPNQKIWSAWHSDRAIY